MTPQLRTDHLQGPQVWIQQTYRYQDLLTCVAGEPYGEELFELVVFPLQEGQREYRQGFLPQSLDQDYLNW